MKRFLFFCQSLCFTSIVFLSYNETRTSCFDYFNYEIIIIVQVLAFYLNI